MKILLYALRRAYLGLIGALLLTAPLLALLRYSAHQLPLVWRQGHGWYCGPTDICYPVLTRDGPFYTFWQTGRPPWDFWPLGLALLAIALGVDWAFFLMARHRPWSPHRRSMT
jgi:hypothetical protein